MTDWLCGFALFAGIFCGDAGTTLSGYVEGETLFVAPIAVNRIATLAVRRGDEVKAGATLATMDADDAHFALEAAETRAAAHGTAAAEWEAHPPPPCHERHM